MRTCWSVGLVLLGCTTTGAPTLATPAALTGQAWRLFSPAYPTANPEGWPIAFGNDQTVSHSSLGNRWRLAEGPTLVIESTRPGARACEFAYDPRGAFVCGSGFETIVLAPRGFDFQTFLNAR